MATALDRPAASLEFGDALVARCIIRFTMCFAKTQFDADRRLTFFQIGHEGSRRGSGRWPPLDQLS